MEEIALKAQLRAASGKGVAHKLRAQGLIPGIFYLGNKVNLPIELSAHELKLILKRKPRIIQLKLDDGSDHECIVRDLQRDPITGNYLHIDFMGIVRGQKTTVQVPVELVGSAYGVRTQGGILQHIVHNLHIECLPKDIPDKVTINIDDLRIGDSVHVSDIVIEDVRLLDDEEQTIVSVLAPRIEKEVEEAADEEGEETEGEASEEDEEEKDKDKEK